MEIFKKKKVYMILSLGVLHDSEHARKFKKTLDGLKQAYCVFLESFCCDLFL